MTSLQTSECGRLKRRSAGNTSTEQSGEPGVSDTQKHTKPQEGRACSTQPRALRVDDARKESREQSRIRNSNAIHLRTNVITCICVCPASSRLVSRRRSVRSCLKPVRASVIDRLGLESSWLSDDSMAWVSSRKNERGTSDSEFSTSQRAISPFLSSYHPLRVVVDESDTSIATTHGLEPAA